MRIFAFITNNFWLKLFSLVLAVSTWFFVFDLVDSDVAAKRKESLEQMMGRYNFVTKEVPVKAFLAGNPPAGYRVAVEKIKIDPPSIMIFGPQEVVDAVSELRTERVDVGEYTRSVKLSLGVRSNVKLLKAEDKIVEVFLPIETVPQARQQ